MLDFCSSARAMTVLSGSFQPTLTVSINLHQPFRTVLPRLSTLAQFPLQPPLPCSTAKGDLSSAPPTRILAAEKKEANISFIQLMAKSMVSLFACQKTGYLHLGLWTPVSSSVKQNASSVLVSSKLILCRAPAFL